jgi:hypothetical protein
MGRKSQLRMLGKDLKTRIRLSPIGKTWEQGKLVGAGLALFRKLAPMEKHIPDCPFCNPLFQAIKTCPDILALPDGSDKEAQIHILQHEECRKKLAQILECKLYKGEKIEHRAW